MLYQRPDGTPSLDNENRDQEISDAVYALQNAIKVIEKYHTSIRPEQHSHLCAAGSHLMAMLEDE